LENVRGHLTLGLKEVLAGLTSVRYDARWQVVRASDAGAPHQRARLFIIAYPNSDACEESRRTIRGVSGKAGEVIYGSDRAIYGCSDQDAGNTNDQHKSHDRQVQELGRRFTPRREMHMQEPPDALDQEGKLNAVFVEYMMGLPVGWVTDTGLSRAQQLKMLGNGVVPQQAKLALELCTEVIHRVHN
jgi:DNA (cytosine-5)-methyltransferase 1